jgi:hypothetical protein
MHSVNLPYTECIFVKRTRNGPKIKRNATQQPKDTTVRHICRTGFAIF